MKLSDVKPTFDGEQPRRIMLYGTHGIGKSTFASCAPKPIGIQTEDGLRDIKTTAFPLAESTADVMQALSELASEKHDFKTVFVDSVDWLERMIWGDVCREGGKESIADFGFGKGYETAAVRFNEFLKACKYLWSERQMMVILIAHCKVERFEDPATEAYDRYVPKLNKHISYLAQEWADEVLFCNYKVFTRKDGVGFEERKIATGSGERVIYTTERPSHLAKNHLGLPEQIPLAFSSYWECVQEAKKRIAEQKEETPF